MSRALFYTLVPGAAARPPYLLCVTRAGRRFLTGHTPEGLRDQVRARAALGRFANHGSAHAALRRARAIHAEHRQHARGLLAQLAKLEARRDAELAALFNQEKRRAA